MCTDRHLQKKKTAMVFTKDMAITECVFVHTPPQIFLSHHDFFSTFATTAPSASSAAAAAVAAAVVDAVADTFATVPGVAEALGEGEEDDACMPRLSDVFRMTVGEFIAATYGVDDDDGCIPSFVPPLDPPHGERLPSNVWMGVSEEGRRSLGLPTRKTPYSMQSLAEWVSPAIALRKFGYDSVAPFHAEGALHDCMYYFLCCWPRETSQHHWAELGVVCDIGITTNIYPSSTHAASK